MDGDHAEGDHAEEETALWVRGSGDRESNARLRDGVVLRTPGPWSTTTLALLRHLEDVGFSAAPRVIGSGFADDGRETLSFVPGESPQPQAWSREAAAAVGGLLRQLHEATSDFEAGTDAVWRPWFGRHLGGSDPVISHCDLGPWNIIAREGMPVAFVDWEYAGPVDAVWDLAHTAWLNAQLYDDDVAELNALGSAEDRARQLRAILDGYGLARRRREHFVDTMVEFAVHSARDEAVQGAVTMESKAVDETGFPVLWAVTWRTRSASWMLHHRSLLEEAILRSA
jgi:Ser/Thr protein kinase RdoA (MazF antagonist)